MTYRYVFGKPYDTEAILEKPEASNENVRHFEKNGNSFSYEMDEKDIVWGLGENVRGMNKRGHSYTSWCSDEFEHSEEKHSLYGAHNFFVIDGRNKIGVFVDNPGKVVFDVGSTDFNILKISIESNDYELYIFEGESVLSIVKEFRSLIGESYIPPRWALGIGQSRWGYGSEEDLLRVQSGYRNNRLPLYMLYLLSLIHISEPTRPY